MKYTHKNAGTCSSLVSFEIDENGCVHNVVFTGGCNGNLKAISRLVEGMKADRVRELLAGNTCGGRQTSCADQLARALNEAGK
jgi:uncharacterized protein (TIGR03905 family)